MKLHLVVTVLWCHCWTLVRSACCNDNYWCDGDPSFLETPNVVQSPNSNILVVSWSDVYLHLSKCVDFYYVEFRLHNGTENELPFKRAPVFFERKTVLDDWEETMKPIQFKYWSNVTVEFNQTYDIRVVAVDKGSGWGENEGKAIVYSKPIVFKSRAFIENLQPQDLMALARQKIDEAYPPETCNEQMLCEELAKEWIVDVSNHVLTHSLRYHDPEFLPIIDLRRSVQEDNHKRKYVGGRIHNLSQAAFIPVSTEVDLEHGLVNMTLIFQVRLLRISYFWESFFTDGILSLYHTCGQKLPLAIFQDVDEEDVDEVVNTDCRHNITVVVVSTLYQTPRQMLPRVSQINPDLRRSEFRYDVTWFSKHFHDLNQLWSKQKDLVADRIHSVFGDAFKLAFQQLKPYAWLRRKFRQLNRDVQHAGLG